MHSTGFRNIVAVIHQSLQPRYTVPACRHISNESFDVLQKQNTFYLPNSLSNNTAENSEKQRVLQSNLAVDGETSSHKVFPKRSVTNKASEQEMQVVTKANGVGSMKAIHSRFSIRLQNSYEEVERQWEITELGNEQIPIKPGVEFSLMSYNVLAQNLIWENLYLYAHCSREELEWNFRKFNLLQEISAIAPDIVCMQEVQYDHFLEFWKPHLACLGYLGVYKKRTGMKCDGCATFYKSSMFELENCFLIEYHRPGINALSKHNVAVIVLLKTKEGGESLCVANTHLLYAPAKGDVKLAQLNVLLAEIDRVAYDHRLSDSTARYCPLIVCGDFNCLPQSHLYRLVSSGCLKYMGLLENQISGQLRSRRGNKGLKKVLLPNEVGISDHCQYVDVCKDRYKSAVAKAEETLPGSSKNLKDCCSTTNSGKLFHNLNLVSVYRHYLGNGQKEATTAHSKDNSTVDYIFYNVSDKFTQKDNVVEGKLKLLGRLQLYSCKQFDEIGRMPNSLMSSDHMSLVARFRLVFDL